MPVSSEPIYAVAWKWLRENDIPNWIILLFTAIVWPIALHYWHRRKYNNVQNLEIALSPYRIDYAGHKEHSAVKIEFINHTGTVVYITSARLRSCSKLFRVPPDASRDIAENSYNLKFLNDNNKFELREITLHTSSNKTATTCIPVDSPCDTYFYSYTANYFRRLFRVQKYFILEYTAMVGPRQYAVATIY